MRIKIVLLIWVLLVSVIGADEKNANDQSRGWEMPSSVQALIRQYCAGCHGAGDEVRLDVFLGMKQENRLALLNKVQDQLFFGLMPPEDHEQPAKVERSILSDWVAAELDRYQASDLNAKLRKPGFGNYIDHDKLFSGQYRKLKGFTYDRRWLISETIFDAKFNRLLNHRPFQTIDGQREFVVGDNNRRVNLTNPFLLPTHTGVRYYANTTLNGGHLLTMITNAKEAAKYMVYLTKRDKRYLPAVDLIMKREWEHEGLLASRESFLNQFIDRVLQELYEDKHDALLPEFVPTILKVTSSPDGKPIKRSPFHAAQPGQQELVLIFQTMQRYQREGDTDAQLIEKCEKEWFRFGHNERKITARLTFLAGYLEDFRKQIEQHRYKQKYRPPVYRAPSSDEMAVISASLFKHRRKGDRYNEIIGRCIEDWKRGFEQERHAAGLPPQEAIDALVSQLFMKIFERLPAAKEAGQYALLTRDYIKSLGNLPAIEKLIQTLILRSEFVYRSEFGQGEKDEFGRRMLSPRDASFALAYALTDSSPDRELSAAAQNGKLTTKADYEREVKRLLQKTDQYYVIDEAVQRIQLSASITNTPIRKLRFFREFFGYYKMLSIFKDNKRFGSHYDNAKGRLVAEADRLVDYILKQDSHVFEKLLTTEDFYVFHSGDNEAMTKSSERIRKIYDYFKNLDWQNFKPADLQKHRPFIEEVQLRGMRFNDLQRSLRTFNTIMTSFTARFDKGQTAAAPFVSFPAHGAYNASTRTGLQLRSPEVARFFNIKLDHWDYPAIQPDQVPNRKGLLTHPAWLIAHAQNTATDPVQRGKWVREKLLAGTVPDIPITVDAVIPEDHHKTLRARLVAVTEKRECWKCHQRMNPLGYAFEMYDDFGRFRTMESLEHPDNLIQKNPEKGGVYEDLRDIYKTLPVNSQGSLEGTGDPRLDGKVENAIDLAGRLAKSSRVRQSIIRYAFRYFMGRNEYLSDSKTLLDADQAYLQSGGSFDAVIVSLLTSDSFIYRKEPGE